MKCLICNFESNDLEDVRKHYLDFHNVNQNNQFFIKLFKKQNNVFHGKKCLRCNEVYFAVVSKLIMIFWFIMTLAETCLRRSLLIIKTLVRYKSMKLPLLRICMNMNSIMQKS